VARSDPNVSRSEGEDAIFGNGTLVHVTVFWEATPYSVVEVYGYSGVSYCHLWPALYCARRWKRKDPPNRRLLFSES